MRKYRDEKCPPLKGKLDKCIEETKTKGARRAMLGSTWEMEGLGSRGVSAPLIPPSRASVWVLVPPETQSPFSSHSLLGF